VSEEDWWSRWFRRRKSPFFFGFRDIDDAFREMEEIMGRDFEELSKRAPRDLIRERTLPDGTKVKRWGPFVYGYSVTIGPDGKPEVREFGNVKPSTRPSPLGYRKPSLELREEREPLVDVIPENGTIRVIAEVPGVNKSDIRLNCSERVLTISVDAKKRKFYKEVQLPDQIDPKVSKATYKNGVLEVLLTKVKPKKPTGETITID